uniref:MAT alpha 1 protein n=1 Tax=Suhomyces chickasaworum TaxID=246045 RepID=A0A3Q9FEG0_9ASCO|nr:MAT alpha 1 protein [Suhomyces chickasaworum]AZQ56699.1 MAT alpha 1 protein [Suhomyces chickasaworum]
MKSRKAQGVCGQRKHITTFRLQKYEFCPNKENVTLQGNLICSAIPLVPNPSEALKTLLLQFNTLNEPSKQQIYKKTSKSKGGCKSSFGNINGFIAFRSFYCKNVKNSDHQIILSRELATIWKGDVNKKIWSLYSHLYNMRENKSTSFVTWLCKTLQMKGTSMPSLSSGLLTVKNNNMLYDTMKIKDAIEDVYFANSDLLTSEL